MPLACGIGRVAPEPRPVHSGSAISLSPLRGGTREGRALLMMTPPTRACNVGPRGSDVLLVGWSA
jgi:hypothetical protein